AAGGAAGVRPRAHDRGGRLYRAYRRAERAAGARARGSRLPARGRPHRARGLGSRAQAERRYSPLVSGSLTDAAMDIYLLEAMLNGVMLGGLLALLALGLNLIFGVI